MTLTPSPVDAGAHVPDGAWLLERVPGAAHAAGHRPSLRAEPERDGWRVYDGDADLCFCDHNPFFDIWRFAPGEEAICHNREAPPAVRDMHTIHNTFLHLPFESGKDLVAGVTQPRRHLSWHWERPDDHEIDLILTADFAEGQGLRYAFRVRFDPDAGRYRYFLDADVWKHGIDGMEPINMMMAGALASRPERRRWTHSVWPDVAWASDAARSGSRSFRMRGHDRSSRRTLMPGGAVCDVEPHSRYRFSGWIRTEGCRRFARLELFSYEYGYGNWIDLATSAKLGGDGGDEDNDWTWVSVELDTEQEAYVMPQLRLYGPGTAWFDDLKLERAG